MVSGPAAGSPAAKRQKVKLWIQPSHAEAIDLVAGQFSNTADHVLHRADLHEQAPVWRTLVPVVEMSSNDEANAGNAVANHCC